MIPPEARPRLARGVRLREDAVRGGHVLLAPERVLRIAGASAAILALCDGARSFEQIVASLAESHQGDGERIGRDTEAFLENLAGKRLVTL